MSVAAMAHNRKRWRNAVFYPVLGVLLAVLLATTACGQERGMPTWSHSQFIEQVESGQVVSLRISADRSQGVAVMQDGQRVAVELRSNDPELVPTLQQNGVAVSVRAQQESVSTLLGIAIALFSLAVTLGSFAFWLWMLIDCATKEPNEGSNKLVWVLIILFVNFLGALAYFLIRRPQRIKELGE